MATAFQINAFQINAFQISIDVTAILRAIETGVDHGEFLIAVGGAAPVTGAAHVNVSVEEVPAQINIPTSVRGN